MKNQKIRGLKKREKEIEVWRSNNLDLRIDLLEKYNKEYVKVWVRPWCDRSLVNSSFPEPKGKIKQLMLNALIDIYYSWKKQLDEMRQPYYLKIWLYETRFSKSQVVAAIGDQIGHYENLFYQPEVNKPLQSAQYGNLNSRLDALKWEYRWDEDHIDNDTVGESGEYFTGKDFVETKKWFDKTMKKPHRTTQLKPSEKYVATEYYSFKKGDLWIGS